jgi:uncharacterized protein with PQ loop repeat
MRVEWNLVHGIIGGLGCLWIVILGSLWKHISINNSCVEKWEKWICHLGNISGLCSSCFWSICILPQLYLNYQRKSTKGLSLRWAVANVTAALINLNFILRIYVPLYMTISAIYMPILEMIVLWQFISYGQDRQTRTVAGAFFAILSLLILIVGLFWNHLSVELAGSFMWIAVTLWSIETFPQLWMNTRSSSTRGQSPETISISFLGKTTDFIAMVSLDIPLQYRIMTYFSTSSAYINIIQYLYYRELLSPATVILIFIMTYSFLMVLKVGWILSCILIGCFLIFLISGYHLDKCLFPDGDDLEVTEKEFQTDAIAEDSVDAALLRYVES